ncbi:MAG: recombinase family protein [Pseudonocardia sp.]|nr:recombinase family protein [Pseudonocardia sp.]
MTETVGYARVSTQRQSLDQQHDALRDAGVAKVFTDKMSGARDDRTGLAELLAYVRPGDTVVVVALDRLGRSLSGIIRTVAALTERGITLRSLRESIDTSTATGRMLVGIFGSLAEYERSLIAERSEVAREAARARGRQTGRPRALSADQAALARRMRDAGESVETIRGTLKVGRSTLYRLLAETEPATS